jgi:hypothetical protein
MHHRNAIFVLLGITSSQQLGAEDVPQGMWTTRTATWAAVRASTAATMPTLSLEILTLVASVSASTSGRDYNASTAHRNMSKSHAEAVQLDSVLIQSAHRSAPSLETALVVRQVLRVLSLRIAPALADSLGLAPTAGHVRAFTLGKTATNALSTELGTPTARFAASLQTAHPMPSTRPRSRTERASAHVEITGSGPTAPSALFSSAARETVQDAALTTTLEPTRTASWVAPVGITAQIMPPALVATPQSAARALAEIGGPASGARPARTHLIQAKTATAAYLG